MQGSYCGSFVNNCGRNPVWKESCVGGIPCGRNPMWEESCMGGILCGRNPMREESCVVGILGGMNPVWEESCWEEFHDYPARYSQLGTASSLEELRSTLEKSLGVAGDTLRFILIQLAVPVPDYVIDRCPAPEWVIMRSKNKLKFILILFIKKAWT